jgi:hypothetical protein
LDADGGSSRFKKHLELLKQVLGSLCEPLTDLYIAFIKQLKGIENLIIVYISLDPFSRFLETFRLHLKSHSKAFHSLLKSLSKSLT